MHARVGPPRPHDGHARSRREPGEGRLEHTLHRPALVPAGLELPAEEVGPVVGEGHPVEGHQRPGADREPGLSGLEPWAH